VNGCGWASGADGWGVWQAARLIDGSLTPVALTAVGPAGGSNLGAFASSAALLTLASKSW
jgi:hypothetical protein